METKVWTNHFNNLEEKSQEKNLPQPQQVPKGVEEVFSEFKIVLFSMGLLGKIMNVLRFSKSIPKLLAKCFIDTYLFSSEEMSYDLF